jgi:hypothetical protein
MNKSKREERLGLVKVNKWGDTMKIIEYNSAQDIVVEFQDEWKETKNSDYKAFEEGNIVNPHIYKQRIGMTNINSQGYTMKVVDYIDYRNVVIEFQDDYREQVKCTWGAFERGTIKNHYIPFVCGVGMVGTKYPATINGKKTKEYASWSSMIARCHTKSIVNGENHFHRYEDVVVCDEWLLYENFYEWLHSQENFDKWILLDKGVIDKDILIKNNKIYSPETCCLVSQNINMLFAKSNKTRGEYPIGVTYKTRDKVFEVQCNLNGKETYLGRRSTPEQGFLLYKQYKESYIKQVAQEEYSKGNITKQCYEAMMNYEVEITD